MTDEASQTFGLEEGDAAEALADFSRQATNMRRSTTMNGVMFAGDHTQVEASAGPSLDGVMQLPAIRTQLDSPVSPQQEQLPVGASTQMAPLSPRLQPLSSDTLPLVSPLVTSKIGLFSEGRAGLDEQIGNSFPASIVYPSLASETENVGPILENSDAPITAGIVEENLMSEAPPLPAVDDHEDLYGVSPAGHRAEQHLDPLNVFHGAAIGYGELQHPDFGGQFIPDDQYGSHWQSADSLVRQSSSPQDQPDRLYVDGGDENGFFGNDVSSPSAREEACPKYPEPDVQLSSHTVGATWASNYEGAAYPHFPSPDSRKEESVNEVLHPQAPAMSRSHSAHSVIVDLTESDGEEEYESEDDDVDDDGSGDPLRGEDISEEDIEESDDESGDGSADKEIYERERPVHGRFFTQNDALADEDVSQGSDDEEGPEGDDCEGDENNSRYNHKYEEEFDEEDEDALTYDQDGEVESDEEDDEANYDEEEMEEDNRPPMHRAAPVVIDLLSSDDEDNETKIPQKLPSQEPKSTGDEDDKRNGSDTDAQIDHVRYGTRDKLGVGSPGQLTEGPTGESQEDHISADNENEELPAALKSDDEMVDVDRNVDQEDAVEVEDAKIAQVDSTDQKFNNPSDSDGKPSDAQSVRSYEEDDSENHEFQGGKTVAEGLDTEYIVVENENLTSATPPLSEHSPENSLLPPMHFTDAFSYDGASDEPISYPALPNGDGLIPPASEQIPRGTVTTGNPDTEEINPQLPTPDATQLSQIKSQVSFSFTTGLDPITGSTEDLATLPTDPALESELDTTLEAKEKHEVYEHFMSGSQAETNETVAVSEETTKSQLNDINGEVSEEIQGMTEVHTPGSNKHQQSKLSVPNPHNNSQSHEEPIRVSPRRSQRIVKSGSTSEPVDSARPATPNRPLKKVDPESTQMDSNLEGFLDDQTTPMGHDASVEMVMATLDSPTRQHDLRRSAPVDLKLKLTRALRTEKGLQDFTGLKTLRFHLGKKLDVLVVATTASTEPQRAKGGPRHYQIAFNVTDSTMTPSQIIEIQVFRPYKEALPIVNVGDGVMLRNFVVISVKGGFVLRSDQETSSWVVFKDEHQPEVRGPPVEYGVVETGHIDDLKSWFRELDSVAAAKINRANAKRA